MSHYELKFFLRLQTSLRYSYLIYALLAVAAFANCIFKFHQVDPVFSFSLGLLMSFVSFSNYLGDTELHTCGTIIEALINKDPELIRQLNDVKEGLKKS